MGRSSAQPCRSATEVEGWLGHRDLSILGAAPANEGIQKALVLTLSVPDGPGRIVFRAKWRPYTTTTEYTQPRRELAVYAVQRLFLDDGDLVVPPAAAYCFDVATYRIVVDPDAAPTFPSTSCVFGVLSYWLEAAVPLDDVDWLESDRGPLDLDLFRENRTYARSVAQLNLLTYLIDHDDSHDDQFLASRDASHPAVFIVDNSMCFDSPFNTSLGEDDDWSRIQVPAFPKDTLARVVSLDHTALSELTVINEFAFDGATGRLWATTPTTPGGDLTEGIRWATPTRLQVGLERAELEILTRRLEALRDNAERGSYSVF